jgi:hypothetical protein
MWTLTAVGSRCTRSNERSRLQYMHVLLTFGARVPRNNIPRLTLGLVHHSEIRS